MRGKETTVAAITVAGQEKAILMPTCSNIWHSAPAPEYQKKKESN
jgi:hypothetical protein